MANQTATFVPKLSIEAIQTVTPIGITEPRQARQVLAAGELVDPGIFQRCLNMVQYYKKEKEEDSGWLLAGWIKETLGRALMVQPMISGRLRKREKDEGELEIVANDCGIRLIEARMEMNLSECLDLKPREDVEAQLGFWKDIDEQNPQFSPLFYVQVTNFQCGGYAIGISCSILLTDHVLKKEFLMTWADIHNNHVINKNNEQKLPLFYLPGLKNTPNGTSPSLITSSSSTNAAKTMIFKVNAGTKSLESEWCREMALACIEEAENILGHAMCGEFSLFVNESYEAIKIESCSRQGMSNSKPECLNRARWDDLGANDVSFGHGNKPALVSYWLRSLSGGFVIVMPSVEDDTYTVIVTIPNEKSG